MRPGHVISLHEVTPCRVASNVGNRARWSTLTIAEDEECGTGLLVPRTGHVHDTRIDNLRVGGIDFLFSLGARQPTWIGY